MGLTVVTVAGATKCERCAALEAAMAKTQVLLADAMSLLQLYQRVLDQNQALRDAVAAAAAAQAIREIGV